MDARSYGAGRRRRWPSASCPLWRGSARPRRRRRGFAGLRDRYFVRALALNPVTATYLGGDTYSPTLRAVNGRLRDYRPAALAAERAFYQETKRAWSAIRPASLTPAERIDHAVMGAQLDFVVLHQLEGLRYHQRSVDTYVAEPFRGIDWQIQQMSDAGNRLLGSAAEWDLVVARLQAVPGYLTAARGNLTAGKGAGNIPDWRMVERDGIGGSRSNAENFRKTLPELAAKLMVRRPFAAAAGARLRTAAERAAASYENFALFLRRTYDADGSDRFAVGEREYMWRVRNNVRDTRTAQQLFDYGKEQVALYQEKIYVVAQRVAREANLSTPFDTTDQKNAGVRAVMDHLARDAPRNDDELLQWYVHAGKRAVQYGRERGLFDIPADYRLDVHPHAAGAPQHHPHRVLPRPSVQEDGREPLLPDAHGQRPGGAGPEQPRDGGRHGDPRGVPRPRLALQVPHAERARDLQHPLADPGLGGGLRLHVAGLDGGRRVGAVLRRADVRAHRGAPVRLLHGRRVHVRAPGAAPPRRPHRGGRGDAHGPHGLRPGGRLLHGPRQLLPERLRPRRHRAHRQGRVRGRPARHPRYGKWPTQAITYNLGKNAIIQLCEAYRQARGSSYSPKEFHERFMKMGMIPPGYYRESFLADARR